MKLLLDTHIWLWSLLEPERLSERVRGALQSPESELYLSPVSVWEAIVLAQRGRISVTRPVAEWVEQMVRAIPRREAPLTHDIAIMSQQLSIPHQDPADRFLAATARVMGLTLVTADDRLLQSSEFQAMANV